MFGNEGAKSSKIGGTYTEKRLPLKIRNIFIVSRLADGSRKFITTIILNSSWTILVSSCQLGVWDQVHILGIQICVSVEDGCDLGIECWKEFREDTI